MCDVISVLFEFCDFDWVIFLKIAQVGVAEKYQKENLYSILHISLKHSWVTADRKLDDTESWFCEKKQETTNSKKGKSDT